jgi:hypothetical protein
MATTAVSEVIVQFLHGVPGGFLPNSIAKYINVPKGWQPPDWHKTAGARSYTGPVPEDVTIVDVSERPMDFTPPPVRRLRNADLRELLGLSDEQITTARDLLGMPKGELQFDADLNDLKDVRTVWRSDGQHEPFDRWLQAVKFVFPKALDGLGRALPKKF